MRLRRERALAVRREAQRARVANRPGWPTTDLAWAAGMFEGEGTVTIQGSGARGYGRCLASLTSTDPEIIAFFQERWSGALTSFRRKPQHRLAQTWTVSGEPMIGFLLDIQPHLRTAAEHEKVALVLECQWQRRRGVKDPAYREAMMGYMHRIRTLNQRGEPVVPA